MAEKATDAIINLIAVIVAVTDEVPRILVIDYNDQCALPNGPFSPRDHASLEEGLRRMVEMRTGLDLAYVEQLYTFGNRYRDPIEIAGGPRVVSIAYIALTRQDPVDAAGVRWGDWYRFLPWEDWRTGRPRVIDKSIEPALQRWVRQAGKPRRRKDRQQRLNVTFGDYRATEIDAILSLERFELLYEAGLVAEAHMTTQFAVDVTHTKGGSDLLAATGIPMVSDHRRVLATALGRLRGKLAYRPVVFELLPGEFTLLQLQRVAEALGGARLHKQNFRRLVANADLVEAIGRTTAIGRGRPAELFRFRREVLGEKVTVGLSRPIMRSEYS